MDNSKSFIERFYNRLIAPETIKICGYAVMGLYLGLVFIGVLIAIFLGPDGYMITTHYISDLGSIKTTPAPYLYDIACICAGIFTIPFIYFLEKHIAPIPRKSDDLPAPHRWNYRLLSWAFFSSMFGSIFYIGVGIFSADRDIAGLHTVCSFGAFGGFTFAAIFLGLALIFLKQNIVFKPLNYPLGLIGVFLPITIAVYNLIYGGPLLEWLLLFAILIWIIPLFLLTLRYIEKIEKEQTPKVNE
ncbi:MAG: DUF998 domain-containing protein [Promethearchaeota archaeon]|nr:MAG: DUF998 domain-containing protein [Candidatus Lokiarchaeota archaeon]